MPVSAQDTVLHHSIIDSASIPIQVPDSVLHSPFSILHSPLADTTRSIRFWHISEQTGEIIPIRPDTFLTDYFNRTNVEGLGVAIGYLGNLGSPLESRVFFERADRSQFMFADAFSAYNRSPDKFNFINTKIPYSTIAYQRAGDRINREERLQGLLAVNLGKKLNVGMDVDYIYARGFYDSQAARRLDWTFFGNYLSDRQQVHLFINPYNYTNAENGGIQNDTAITHPEYLGVNLQSRDIPIHLNKTWNHINGQRIYLNYRYNLGFERNTRFQTEEGDTVKQFVPVSSIIYTLDYQSSKKKFYTNDSALVANYYAGRTNYFADRPGGVNDSTSFWLMSNTVALSLREGFSEWAKFNLTAFLTYDVRNFTTMDSTLNRETTEHAVYVGGELSKQTGKFLRYHARGSFGMTEPNLGDFNLSGTIETRIPFWGDTAALQANASFKNLAPTYYENHYHSRYFWWDNDFSKIKKVYIGGSLDIPHTKTRIGLGVENVNNYIYFDKTGMPAQHNQNIQVIAARIKQDFQFRALHWDNELVYQKSGNEEIIPLPDFAAYSSLYIQFQIAKVLTIQTGVNGYYWTKYYAPGYEPATQQFKLQDQVKVGNYPLLNAFVNCHLKQTRFFLEYYNAGASYIAPPGYFSLPHYPVDPTVLKMGLSVHFVN